MTEHRTNASFRWPPHPYIGLNSFSRADAPLFSQREVEITDVIALLSSFDTRVLLLHGGPGVGKSSFLRAGLYPRLQELSHDHSRKFYFLREEQSNSSLANPLVIRATNDPVARIYECLRIASQADSDVLSQTVRQRVCESLNQTLPQDRRRAIPAILAALEALTAPPQRLTFVLLVDQAEEVLTLPMVPGIDNARSSFFELIEQICFRSFDLRVIIALRTEYYGRFCSAFMIQPTNNLTPRTEFGAGLMDYLLRPLTDVGIAAAIRLPTLNGLENSPRSFYNFSYEDRLPETIAADLLRQAEETSTLPAMQIVCRNLYERVVRGANRRKITEQDYIALGRAEGAIDAFVVQTLRDAALAAKLPELSEADLDVWVIILSHVVGRAEGGTIQTLIASQRELLTEAVNHGISEDAARAMLCRMADPERRLLRVAGGEAGTSAYSLGHDSLGPSILHRSSQASTRAEAARQRAVALAAERRTAEALLAKQREDQRIKEERYRLRLKFAQLAIGALALLAVVGFSASKIVPLQARVSTLTFFSEQDQSADFRLRLLLLAAALRISETWPASWFVQSEASERTLREVLLRSPVFGGTFDAAAWDYGGQRVIRLEDDKLVVRDLKTGHDGDASEIPPASPVIGGTTSIGFATLEGGIEELVAFRSTNGKPMMGRVGSTLVEGSLELPPELTQPDWFIARADIFGKHVRILFFRFSGSTINQMRVAQIVGSARSSFMVQIHDIDWMPFQRQAVRQPVLAEDCDAYAFFSRATATKNTADNRREFTLWLGHLNDATARSIKFEGDTVLGAVAIARGCGSVVVRDDANHLHIISLNGDPKALATRTVSLDLDPEIEKISAPNTPQVQPMFAAAPLSGLHQLRVGWPTTNGLAFVDINPGDNRSATLLNNRQMLTGLEPGYGIGSLSLSPDGSFALLMKRQNFNAQVQLRAYNLDIAARRAYLAQLVTTDALIHEACGIAKLQTGSNQLTASEREVWLGDRDAPQPCNGKE